MRRAVSSITVAIGLLTATAGLAGAALAAPAPSSSDAAPAAGKKRCSVTAEQLRELSGLVATKTGYIVVNDSTDVESHKRVFYLNAECEITKSVQYSGQGPLDPEDLALSPDGETLWIADIGDNAKQRERVALWTMPVDGSKRPELHRVAYPERKPHDAEALLVGDDGKPLIITKTLSGKAEIFTPAAKLRSNNAEPVPMEKVGEIGLPKTTTPNLLQGPGRIAITGAARSPDGSRVVLRTYADAFEYKVSGGDVVAALTKGEPLVTPLADPFGEAISYTPDAKLFVTVSDAGQLGEDAEVDILAYPPSTRGAQPVAEDPKGKKEAAGGSWLDGLSLDDVTYLIAAIGVLGALLVGAGIFGIVRARRRPQPAAERGGRTDRADPDDPYVSGDLSGRGGGGRRGVDDPYVSGDLSGRGGVGRRGAGPPGAGQEPRRGAVYGGQPAPGGGRPGGRADGGGVYGGAAPPAAGAPYDDPAAPKVYGGGRGGPGAPPGGAGAGGGRGGYRGGGRGAAGAPGGGRGASGAPGGRGTPGGLGSGVYGGGSPGGVYGGGRAEPPRRGAPGRRRDDPDEYRRRGGHDPEEGYGRGNGPGHDYRGTRY